MQVDIPSYDLEDANGEITHNGTYLIPVVWNQRLLVFFPHFMKKAAPVDNKPPVLYWDIRMAWSEYRNGTWTHKQVSYEAVYDFPLSPIDRFRFAPRIMTGADPILALEVFHKDVSMKGFVFSGSQRFSEGKALTPSPDGAIYHVILTLIDLQVHSLQAVDASSRLLARSAPYLFIDKYWRKPCTGWWSDAV